MKVDLLLRETHEHEQRLRVALLRLSERHKADHEVYHVARDLAGWSGDHVRRIAEVARDHGVRLDADPRDESTVGKLVREKISDAIGRRSASGMLLVHDLRKIYLQAADLSIDWELVGQAAQGVKDAEMLALSKECHPGTLRQMRWANAMVKTVSPQVLAT